MAAKKFTKDLDFLYEIGSLRHLVRTWTQFVRSDVANVSEHIYRVVWIALMIAKHENVTTTDKIMKMATKR
ncbi:HD domain-containing protein [Candidatus Microgenomates bacterium]|nr:HD domain-containing protein [Candidatus Microgenomates bacterium]